MTKYIRFYRKERLTILFDFKESVIKDIENKLITLSKTTNKFNFYTIEDFITTDNLKEAVLLSLKNVNLNFDFESIKINTNAHKKENLRVMHIKILDSFKGLPLESIIYTKWFKIEEEISEDILKLEGREGNIDLNSIHLNYEYK